MKSATVTNVHVMNTGHYMWQMNWGGSKFEPIRIKYTKGSATYILYYIYSKYRMNFFSSNWDDGRGNMRQLKAVYFVCSNELSTIQTHLSLSQRHQVVPPLLNVRRTSNVVILDIGSTSTVLRLMPQRARRRWIPLLENGSTFLVSQEFSLLTFVLALNLVRRGGFFLDRK